jgi:hypothetical protein
VVGDTAIELASHAGVGVGGGVIVAVTISVIVGIGDGTAIGVVVGVVVGVADVVIVGVGVGISVMVKLESWTLDEPSYPTYRVSLTITLWGRVHVPSMAWVLESKVQLES